MAKQVKWRRGNTAQHSTFVGVLGEITINTDTWGLRVHDGTTVGGHVINVGSTNYSNANALAYLTANEYALKSYVDSSVNNLIAGAPGALDTLNELANALGNNASFSTTVTNSLSALTSNAAVQAGLIASITNGTALFGNIIPSANVTYSLGNVTHQWKDLWVSNNTIYINSVPLSIDAGGNLLINGAPVSGGAASTADITFANTSISAADDSEITVDAKTAERIRAKLRLEPTSGDAYLEAWSGQNTRSENDTNWTTGVWENNIYGNPLMTFTGAFDLAFFVVETLQSSADPDTVSYSINGGPYIAWDGGSSADTSTGYVQIYTSGVSPNVSPTAITSLDWRYAYKSSMGISHGSGAIQITGRNQYLQVDIDQYILVNSKGSIEFNNSNYGNNVDIELRSGDDILLQAKDKTTSDNEGGDILIYAGDGGDADAGDPAGTGGDIVIEAGIGGSPSAAYDGAAGGTLDLYGGAGGSADTGNNRAAKDGGRARLRAGSAGSNNGNVALGAVGGPVEITAGSTTLANTNGGTVTITGGQGGPNALAGNVEINTPISDLGLGGTWTFDGNGQLTTPSSLRIAPAGLFAPVAGTVIYQDVGQTLSIASNGNVSASTLIGWYENFTSPGNVAAIGMNVLDSGGVGIITGDQNTTVHNWVFDKFGNLTLPGNIASVNSGINFVANSSGDGNGYSTIELRPDTELNTDQYIIVDPTGGEPGHIHLRAGGTQDASGADLYLGGELTAVRVSDTSGIVTVRTTNIGDPNITLNWLFQPDGNLYFPGIGNNRIGESEPGLVVSSDNSVVLQSNNNGASNEWLFGTNGNLTFPDSTVQTTAWTGEINNYVVGYRDVPQVAAGNVTLGLTDAGKHYYANAAHVTTLTIPSNANVAFPIGTAITIVNAGSGNISISKQSTANLYLAGNSTNVTRTLTSYGMATLLKTAADQWFINGTGLV